MCAYPLTAPQRQRSEPPARRRFPAGLLEAVAEEVGSGDGGSDSGNSESGGSDSGNSAPLGASVTRRVTNSSSAHAHQFTEKTNAAGSIVWRQPFSRTTRRGTTAGVLVGRVYKSSHGRGEKELPKWCRHGGDDNDNEDPRGTVIKQDGVTLSRGL